MEMAKGYWPTTFAGSIKINQMDDDHLQNTMLLIIKTARQFAYFAKRGIILNVRHRTGVPLSTVLGPKFFELFEEVKKRGNTTGTGFIERIDKCLDSYILKGEFYEVNFGKSNWTSNQPDRR